MNVTSKQIIEEIKKGKISNVYFLQGEEVYFIDEISDFIEKNVLSDSEKAFNQVILYGKDESIPTILTHAKRFPMMADRQVVIVKEAQEIPDLNQEAGYKLLLDYLSNSVPSTVLVFCHKHKTLDKRKVLGKQIESLATVVTFKKLYDNQIPDFIQRYLQENNMLFGEGVVQALSEYVGNDLSRLTNEMDKVRLSLKDGELLNLNHIFNQVGISKEFNVFELQSALVQQDIYKSQLIAKYFSENIRKNPLIVVVAFLYSFFSKLLVAASLEDKSSSNIAKVLKMSPYIVRNYSNALSKFPLEKIKKNLAYLNEADLKLKGVNSGSQQESELMKELFFKLIFNY